MQAAYALTRLILFGFGWGIATGMALAAEEMLPGVKWPILGLSAALWTFVYALYVAGEANRIGAASSASPLPQGDRRVTPSAGPATKVRHCEEPTGPAFGRPDDKLRDEAIQSL